MAVDLDGGEQLRRWLRHGTVATFKAIAAREIVDASQTLPAGGLAIVAAKDDMTVDGNPELSALLRELKQLNDSLQ